MENLPASVVSDESTFIGDTAHTYDDHRFTTLEGIFIERYEKELFQSILRSHHVKSVLDVPVGTGRIAIPLANEFEFTGTDLSPDMLALAQAKAEARGVHNITWKCGNVAELPFDDCTFDAVCTARLFQHLPTESASAVINELMRVVKPNGILIVQFRSGLYGFIIQFVKYYIIRKRGRIRNLCIFPGQVRTFFGSRNITYRYGYKFPGSGRLSRLFGYRSIAFVNRLLSCIPGVRWLGAYMTFVVPREK